MGCFIYGGIDYTEILEVASVEMPALPKTSPDLRYATGRDGALLASNPFEPLEIKVKARLVTDTIDPRDIQRKWAETAATMRHSEPQPLSLSDGIWRMAVLTDETKLEFKSYSAFATLTFLCPDPIAYGDEYEIIVPSGGSVTFNVGGTYPARPTVSASAVRDAASLVWGIRLDGEDFLHIATGSASARGVEVDCGARTCIVNSEPSLPTLDSDWLAFEPGTHTIVNDEGSGAATVTYRERWL